MKKKMLALLAAVLCLVICAAAVSADQNGNAKWCNVDDFGCWVIDENDEKIYIMFWSDAARIQIMGEEVYAVTAPMPIEVSSKSLKMELEEKETVLPRIIVRDIEKN